MKYATAIRLRTATTEALLRQLSLDKRLERRFPLSGGEPACGRRMRAVP